jgi:hypothetical protein
MTTENNVTVIEAEPAQLPAVSESAALLQVIERMAVNPAVDVEKFERLMALQERMVARNAKTAYHAALAELQPKLPVIGERGEIKIRDQVQSRYALWEDVVRAIAPLLSEHGFALSFRVSRDTERQNVTGILSHRDGHSEETTLSLPIDNSGSKNGVQGIGSTVSYGKRYVTQALLNLVSSGDDDDGQGGGNGLITAEQKAELVELLKANGATYPDGAGTKKFLDFMGVASLDEINASDFNKGRLALAAKAKKTDAPA